MTKASGDNRSANLPSDREIARDLLIARELEEELANATTYAERHRILTALENLTYGFSEEQSYNSDPNLPIPKFKIPGKEE